jgi:hypothetical protein
MLEYTPTETGICVRWYVFHCPDDSFSFRDVYIQITMTTKAQVTGFPCLRWVVTPRGTFFWSKLVLPSPIWTVKFLGRGSVHTVLSYPDGTGLGMMN